MSSEMDSEMECPPTTHPTHTNTNTHSVFPYIDDIDFDMDTTEYEIYRDYVDEVEEDKDPGDLLVILSDSDAVESNGSRSMSPGVQISIDPPAKNLKSVKEPVSFPSRLFDVVEEEDSAIIGWRDYGTSFCISDVASFVTDILFRRFKRTHVLTIVLVCGVMSVLFCTYCIVTSFIFLFPSCDY